MVVNCASNKTEYVCFSKAKGDIDIVPSHMPFGHKEINRVDVTCVLGLYLDQNLNFIHHSDRVYSKLLYRWTSILKYGNNQSGLNQRVMRNLIKVLFLPTLMYGGMLWLNRQTLYRIKNLWYKVIKTSIGATFNVKTEICEIILGLPPLELFNEVNTIKHFMTLNIKKSDNDPLRHTMLSLFEFSGHSCSLLQSHLSSAFKFLHWKLCHHAVSFTTADSHIVLSNDFRRFTELSSDCCSYSKHMINCYVEFKWQSRVDNQWLLNGYSMAPIVSCEILSFDSFVNRKTETLCLSFFYPNNLLNSFLFDKFPDVCSTPLCGCGESDQTMCHILFECKGSLSMPSDAAHQLRERICEAETNCFSNMHVQDFCTILLNHSRDKGFMSLLSERIQECTCYLKSSVKLTP